MLAEEPALNLGREPAEDLAMSIAVFAALALGAVLLLATLRRGEDGVKKLAIEVPGAPGSIEAALAAGRKIDAIKLYREQHGVGLKEAKEAVEALQRSQSDS